MAIIHIGIGSNLGSRKENCKKAIGQLLENGITVTKMAAITETEPWGVADQQKFMNTAVEARTDLGPGELLEVLKEIEREMGRLPSTRWGPRLVDLDILFYDDLVMNTADLEIPHPLIKGREFVLRPLAEIAPDKKHPVFKKTVREMLEELKR